MTFKLFVTYIAKPDCREQFVREVIQNRILQDIRAEKGCLQYEYFFSVDDVNKILISEEWDPPLIKSFTAHSLIWTNYAK